MSIKITEEIKNHWLKFINQREDLSHLKDYKFEAWSFGNSFLSMMDFMRKTILFVNDLKSFINK